MADVNLPSISELGQMDFLPSAQFQQANNQINLANMFQQQNLATGQEDLLTKQLANQLTQQTNPLKTQRMGLENTGLDIANTIKNVEARTKQALEPDDINAQRQKMLTELDDDKLKQFASRASWEMMQDDPKLQASGLRKIMASKAEFDRRNKQSDVLEKVAAEGANSANVANIHAGASRDVANINSDARRAVAETKAKGVQDFDQALAQGKFKTLESALTYATMQAQFAQNPDEQATWTNRARQLETLTQNKALAGSAGKIDPGAATGLPTIQTRSGFATPTAQPGVQGAFDLGPNNERLAGVVEKIRAIPDPQERANAAKALENQVNGKAPQAGATPSAQVQAPAGKVAVISPDGKKGFIPADQLEAATKQGYKQR